MPHVEMAGISPTHEQYIISLASVHNTKIRADHLDIKTLVNVDALGLQQWQPTLKAEFPLDSEALNAAWSAWGIPHPIVERTHCTRDQFLCEVVASEACLRVVDVEKRRSSFLVQGCPGERVALTIGAQQWESISFEHQNPYRVWRAVRALGLENCENTSYPLALKRITGFQLVEQPIKEAV